MGIRDRAIEADDQEKGRPKEPEEAEKPLWESYPKKIWPDDPYESSYKPPQKIEEPDTTGQLEITTRISIASLSNTAHNSFHHQCIEAEEIAAQQLTDLAGVDVENRYKVVFESDDWGDDIEVKITLTPIEVYEPPKE